MKYLSKQRLFLAVATAVAILAVAGFGIASRVKTAAADLEKEREELSAEYDRRKKIDNTRKEYKAQTDAFDRAYELITAKYPNGITQNNQLMFLREIEDEFGLRITSASYTDAEILYRFRSTAPGNSEPYSLVRSTMQFPVELSYDEWKRFIRYIEETDGCDVIQTMIADYDDSGSRVSADVTICQYAIIGDDREVEELTAEVSAGTDNIFYAQGISMDMGMEAEREEVSGQEYINVSYGDGGFTDYSTDDYSENSDNVGDSVTESPEDQSSSGIRSNIRQ